MCEGVLDHLFPYTGWVERSRCSLYRQSDWIQYSEHLYCVICEPLLNFRGANLFLKRYLSKKEGNKEDWIMLMGEKSYLKIEKFQWDVVVSSIVSCFFLWKIFLKMWIWHLFQEGYWKMKCLKPKTTTNVVQQTTLSEKVNQKLTTKQISQVAFRGKINIGVGGRVKLSGEYCKIHWFGWWENFSTRKNDIPRIRL